jgi:NAD(P)-dependent dehydrogenase (short-subunit alcohol dehydrogenase family)
MRLEHQVALITGASHGLGLAIARSLAAEGAAIACVARPGPELDRAVAELRATGSPALAAAADVTRADEVERAVQATLEQWGRLDIVVLNAGTWKGGALHEMTEAAWDQLLDLNLKGAFLTLKAALPWLIERRRGTIVGIASLGAWVGQANASAYAASKWGLRGLLESVALEVKPHGIRVSIVAPHNINSAGRTITPGGEERLHHLEPAEIAALVAFVCTAPDHVAVGNVTVWPVGAGIVSQG